MTSTSMFHVNDEEFTQYLSQKVNIWSTEWIQSIYFELFSNYQQLFNAHNALKSDYDKLREENQCKQLQIDSLRQEYEFARQQILEYKSQNTEDWNHETLLNSLNKQVNALQKELIFTKSDFAKNSVISTKTIKNLQNERYEQQQQLRRLQKENQKMEFELNSLQKESAFYQKNIANETNIQNLNYEQAKKNYAELRETHCSNMKSMHCFLNALNVRCNSFLAKYDSQNNNDEMIIKDEQNVKDETMYFTKNIQPKLTLNQAKIEEFLNKIKMILISQKTSPPELDLNLTMSEFDEDDA